MKPSEIQCRKCGGPLMVKRSCKNIRLCCRLCSAEYSLEQFTDSMDEYLEEMLAHIPCDRL